MKEIKEEVIVRAQVPIIWRVWSDNYLKKGMSQGKDGVYKDKKNRVKFKVIDVQKNRSMTLMWYSFFVKMLFTYTVDRAKNGALVSCRVNLKGFLAPVIGPFIKNKIKKYLKESLSQFKNDLERHI